jgi:plasmid stabilization system protein ParE
MNQVWLSPLAAARIELLLAYLEVNWSKKSRNAFLSELTAAFQRIAQQPRSCPESKEMPNLFKCVVSPQSSFYYRIMPDGIEVITLIDNRQNPVKTLKELRSILGQ